jgi:hypothetical protein
MSSTINKLVSKDVLTTRMFAHLNSHPLTEAKSPASVVGCGSKNFLKSDSFDFSIEVGR